MITFTSRFGITEPLLIQLTQTDPITGVTTVYSLAGVSNIAVHLRGLTTTTVTDVLQGAGVSISDAANGIIALVPPVVAGLYSGWITFTGGGKTQSFPSTDDFQLVVLEAY